MPGLRIRKPFAGTSTTTSAVNGGRNARCKHANATHTTAAFALLLLAAAYLGLSTQKIPSYGQSDKGLHFITFFLLTVRAAPARPTHTPNTPTHPTQPPILTRDR